MRNQAQQMRHHREGHKKGQTSRDDDKQAHPLGRRNVLHSLRVAATRPSIGQRPGARGRPFNFGFRFR